MSSLLEHEVSCPDCGETIQFTIEVVSHGHPGRLPSLNYPGDPPEGPEWYLTTDLVVCPECGKSLDHEAINSLCGGNIAEKIDEPPDPPDWDD